MDSTFRPHNAQRKIHDALWPPLRGQVVMVIAGRRFGKTVLAILEIIKRAIEIPGARIWYVAPTKDQAYRIAWRILLYPRTGERGEKLEPYLPPDMIAKRREDHHYVELVNGSLIEFLGCQDEVFLLGAGLHFVVFDEFPTIPYSVWSDTVRPMLLDYNGDALFIGTVPDPKIHNITMPFVEMYEEALYNPTFGLKGFNFTSFDNPYIDRKKIEKDIEDLKRKGRETDALRLYYGKYTREFGVVFPKFSRLRHVVTPFEVPKEWTRVLAVDPHPQKPTCALWCAIDPRRHFWFYRENEFMVPNGERSMTIMEAAYSILEAENKAKEKVNLRLIDPTFAKIQQNVVGAKSIKDILRDYGLHFREASRDFDTYFNRVSDMLVEEPEPTFHILASCPNFIRQMEHYTWESWASNRARESRGVKNKPKKVDDDFVDCSKSIINSNVGPIDKAALGTFRRELQSKWDQKQFM